MLQLLASLLVLSSSLLPLQEVDAEQADGQAVLERALQVCDGFLAENPNDPVGLRSRSRVLYALQRFDEAERDLIACTELTPDSLEVFRALGNLYVQRGEFGAGLQAFQRCQEIDPEDGPVHNMLGLLSLQQGQLRLARSYFMRAADHWPESPLPQLNEALVDYRTGYWMRAADRLQHLCEDFDDLPEARLALARVCDRLGLKTDVQDHLGLLLLETESQSQHLRVDGLCILGDYFFDAGLLGRAQTCFEEAILAAQTPLPVCEDLAEIYLQRGRGEDAVSLLRVSAAQYGGRRTRITLGRALAEQGDLEGALVEFEALLQLGVRSPEVLVWLSRLAESCGDPDGARLYYRELRELGRQHRSLQAAPDYVCMLLERALRSSLDPIRQPEEAERLWSRLQTMVTQSNLRSKSRLQELTRRVGWPQDLQDQLLVAESSASLSSGSTPDE